MNMAPGFLSISKIITEIQLFLLYVPTFHRSTFTLSLAGYEREQ